MVPDLVDIHASYTVHESIFFMRAASFYVLSIMHILRSADKNIVHIALGLRNKPKSYRSAKHIFVLSDTERGHKNL